MTKPEKYIVFFQSDGPYDLVTAQQLATLRSVPGNEGEMDAYPVHDLTKREYTDEDLIHYFYTNAADDILKDMRNGR